MMIVVAAAGGRLGRAVAAALEHRVDPAGVTLAARRPQALTPFAARGFRTVHADYEDQASLLEAFRGAETVLVVTSTGPGETRLRHHKAAIDAAVAAGAGRIVLTSFSGAVPGSRNVWSARVYAPSEAHLRHCGLPWTILRNGQYATNLDTPVAAAARSGVFAMPALDARVAYVTHDDLGVATASVLAGGAHAGRIYDLTGPAALDGQDIAAMVARALDRPVAAADVPAATFGARLLAEGWPEHVVTPMLTMYEAAAAGDYAAVSDDIAALTGRAPAPIEAHVAAVARGSG